MHHLAVVQHCFMKTTVTQQQGGSDDVRASLAYAQGGRQCGACAAALLALMRQGGCLAAAAALLAFLA
jgi:hypothetical protein